MFLGWISDCALVEIVYGLLVRHYCNQILSKEWNLNQPSDTVQMAAVCGHSCILWVRGTLPRNKNDGGVDGSQFARESALGTAMLIRRLAMTRVNPNDKR